jgi:hypothetical protein
MSKVLAVIVGGCLVASAGVMVINAYKLNDTVTQAHYFPTVPNSAFTPGDINPAATKEVICVKGYTSEEGVRHVTEAIKKKVFQEYNLTGKEQHFEIDHLISLELGGSNDIKNLWPESYDTKPVNAHTKDALEDRLHSLVCKGQIDLATAQHDIAIDWEGAYVKYIGPLPK